VEVIFWPSSGGEFHTQRRRAIENNGYKIRQAVWRNPISCELKMPATYESLIQFLAFDPDFRGIGSVKARKLVQAMGNDIVRLATIGDREAFRNHLTDDSIDALIEGFQKYKNLRHAQFLTRLIHEGSDRAV
jgi:exodeoxyribonuclease V alpha subunit